MTFTHEASLYDILDINPDASPQEVREAYLRVKAAYSRDSVALYTLISSDEREEMLERIEEAYETLSSADRRKEYDRSHGKIDFEDTEVPSRVPHNKKIISIDRVPPMESSSQGEEMLVAPATDFTTTAAPPQTPNVGLTVLQGGAGQPPEESPQQPVLERRAGARTVESALAQEIAQEADWRGPFLRKVREIRRISIEEMSNITKVSKSYLLAIEEENFPKLPAPVFMRGFVTQMAKALKLPHDQVAAAYMARYYQTRPEKTAR